MASYVRGIYGYFRPSEKSTEANNNDSTSSESSFSQSQKSEAQPGYLKSAATGVYNLGSGTVSAGVSGVKWIAGSTYTATSSVVSGAGSVASAVGSGASSVVSGAANAVTKVTQGKGKEHKD